MITSHKSFITFWCKTAFTMKMIWKYSTDDAIYEFSEPNLAYGDYYWVFHLLGINKLRSNFKSINLFPLHTYIQFRAFWKKKKKCIKWSLINTCQRQKYNEKSAINAISHVFFFGSVWDINIQCNSINIFLCVCPYAHFANETITTKTKKTHFSRGYWGFICVN